MREWKWSVLVVATACLMAVSAQADVVVLTLDNVVVTQCDEEWIEEAAVLKFTTTTAEDCDGGGNCFFGTESDRVWLYPCRLDIDLSNYVDVSLAEVVIDDYCGTGCTKAFFYAGAVTADTDENDSTGMNSLMLVSNGEDVDRLAVSSCEGSVIEIFVTVGVVATQQSTWGAIKTLY